MDTFAWSSGPGHHDDVYLTRQLSCGRFDLDDVFLHQLQSDVGGINFAGGGTTPCQVSSTYGALGGAPGAGDSTTTGSMGFFGSGVDVFSSVVDGASAHDGLLDSALAFSKVLPCGGDGDPGAVSNGAMFSGYSGTTVCNISSGDSNNNYSGGGGHDATEVASPTSTISPTATSHPTITTSAQALHHANRKLPADDCPAILTAPPLPRAGAKRKAPTCTTTATSITFGQDSHAGAPGGYEPDMEAMAQVKEMIYRAAAMRPVNLITDTEAPAEGSKKPRRKNVRISSDPQTVAARLRRERVSDRLRVLQKLVPGGSKMDTASMLDEAASYLKFLKSQVQALETLGTSSTATTAAAAAASTGRLQQHFYGNTPGFLGFSRNNTNISNIRNPYGNSAKLL